MRPKVLLTCRETSLLVSLSMDRRLSAFKQFQLKFHLLICKICRNQYDQFRMISRIIGKFGSHIDSLPPVSQRKLSDKAKKRITTALAKIPVPTVPGRK